MDQPQPQDGSYSAYCRERAAECRRRADKAIVVAAAVRRGQVSSAMWNAGCSPVPSRTRTDCFRTAHEQSGASDWSGRNRIRRAF